MGEEVGASGSQGFEGGGYGLVFLGDLLAELVHARMVALVGGKLLETLFELVVCDEEGDSCGDGRVVGGYGVDELGEGGFHSV